MHLTEEDRGALIQALLEFKLRKRPVMLAVNRRLRPPTKHLKWPKKKYPDTGELVYEPGVATNESAWAADSSEGLIEAILEMVNRRKFPKIGDKNAPTVIDNIMRSSREGKVHFVSGLHRHKISRYPGREVEWSQKAKKILSTRRA